MDPSLWQHQTIEPIASPVARDTTAQAFVSGVLVGIVIGATVLLWRRSGSRPAAERPRAAVVSGWGELFRFVAGCARGILWLTAVLLTIGSWAAVRSLLHRGRSRLRGSAELRSYL